MAQADARANAELLGAAFGAEIGWPIRTTDVSGEDEWYNTFKATDLTEQRVLDYPDDDPGPRKCRAEIEVEFSLL